MKTKYSIEIIDLRHQSDHKTPKKIQLFQGGIHCCAFCVRNNKSFYFDSFGFQPDKFLLNHLPKPKIYHNYKIQDINSKSCGSYCLYSFYLIEKMNYYDAILKMYFR